VTPTETVARALDLSVVSSLTGGEFGATLVRNRSGQELVLKVSAGSWLAPRWAAGAEMAERLRARGYPAPRYEGTGEVAGLAWSLQERLPGHVPAILGGGHARRLLELAEQHRDAAGREADWLPGTMASARAAASRLGAADRHQDLVRALGSILDLCNKVAVRRGDAVHGDFHHRNFLAEGDTVTGVFDWEGAAPGDWRTDLVTFAFWSQLVSEQWEPAAAAIAVSAMRASVPGEVAALMAAMRSLEVLDFYARVRPAVLERTADLIRERILPWCSPAL
jgi:aminoglycoside phosphotransferase (APT) family kinase protein